MGAFISFICAVAFMMAGILYLYGKYTGAIEPGKIVKDEMMQGVITLLAFVASIIGFFWASFSLIAMV